MTAHLDAYNSAGATISVVKDGEIFFAKGYGYADVEAKKKVEADKTLFRIGSVSKLFVWTAVMQLVEQGKIDLDEDINNYLTTFQIPPYEGKPVTMANLMTHSAGFEDYVVGLFAKDEESLSPLGKILAEQIPARVRPPSLHSSYSNHGTGMAMYIVELASGIPWETYLQDNILGPLGMSHTTFTQPTPSSLADDMSKGYSSSDDGNFKEEDFEYIPLAPVGACGSTATDMAVFMMAHLQFGQYGDVRILEEATARQMQSELFRHHPNVSPMGHGFIIVDTNGERIVGHGGDSEWFHTELALLPKHNLGLFVSHNTDSGGEARTKLLEQFMDRYFPAPEQPAFASRDEFSTKLGRFTGFYRPNRYSHRSIAKLVALLGVEVKGSEDGALVLLGKKFHEVEPLTFRQEDGKRTLVFKEGDGGEITHMFASDIPILVLEKVSFLEKPLTQAVLVVVSVVLFLGAVVLWPTAGLIRRHYRVVLPPEARLPFGSKFTAWMASALLLAFTVMFSISMIEPDEIVYGATPFLLTTLSMPLIASVFALFSVIFLLVIWKNRRGKFLGRVFYSLLCVSFVVFLLQLNHWNLLGFKF
jgi:CubicO group peptidase (beta-lactamase class C family)